MREKLIRHILEDLSRREGEMFSLLKELVLIQSGTYHRSGVNTVAGVIQARLERDTLIVRRVSQEKLGDHLIAMTPPAEKGKRGLLLVGHMDTVFPEDTDFRWYKEDEENVYGPGVIDMKGGLVVGIFALEALHRAGVLKKIPLRFVINSDEEIGSPTSRELIQRMADESCCAFVLECGALDGGVVTGRKGKIGLTLTTRGNAGHAAEAGRDKSSAVLCLSHKVIMLEAMNDPDRGVSVNVGTIKGGIGANTVAEEASAGVDIRYLEPPQRGEILHKVDTVVKTKKVPGGGGKMEITSERPPMPMTGRNRELFEILRKQAERLGITVREELRGGVSDANFIAERGVPVLDGLGPIGGRDHSDKEFMVKKSLLPRAQLLALTLLAAWDRYLAGAGEKAR